MKITFGEFFIRSYRYSDQEALIKYANNYNISRLLRDQLPFPYPKTDVETWLIHARNQEIETNFVIANEQGLIGAIGINLQEDVNRFSERLEIGYWLAEPFWGKGISTQALNVLTKCASNSEDSSIQRR